MSKLTVKIQSLLQSIKKKQLIFVFFTVLLISITFLLGKFFGGPMPIVCEKYDVEICHCFGYLSSDSETCFGVRYSCTYALDACWDIGDTHINKTTELYTEIYQENNIQILERKVLDIGDHGLYDIDLSNVDRIQDTDIDISENFECEWDKVNESQMDNTCRINNSWVSESYSSDFSYSYKIYVDKELKINEELKKVIGTPIQAIKYINNQLVVDYQTDLEIIPANEQTKAIQTNGYYSSVWIDGKDVLDSTDFLEAYSPHDINGKLAYFVSTEKEQALIFDHELINLPYSRIPHYGCCEESQYNITSNDNIIDFFGLKDDGWYHVQIRAEDEIALDSEFVIITSEGFPPGQYEEIIDHALIISDPDEIASVQNDYENVDQNHACGYTHIVEFWSNRNTLDEVGAFNEEISCGGKALEIYVKKLAETPSHYIYLVRIPSEITINQLDDDFKQNGILSFIDIQDPKHLPYIDVSLDVYYPNGNDFSKIEEEDYSSNEIKNLISDISDDLKVHSSAVDYFDYCGYFSKGGDEGCSSRIRLRFDVDQDLEYAEEYLSKIENLEIRTVSNHSNYVISVYDKRDSVQEVREAILDKIDYIISVDKYNH